MKIFKVLFLSASLFINRPFFGSELNWNDYSKFRVERVTLKNFNVEDIYWVRGSRCLGWQTALVSGPLDCPVCIRYKLYDGRYIVYDREKLDEFRYTYYMTIDETGVKSNQNFGPYPNSEFRYDGDTSEDN